MVEIKELPICGIVREDRIKLERERIINIFNKMTRDELLKVIDENLYFNEDFCVDIWTIDVPVEIEQEVAKDR